MTTIEINGVKYREAKPVEPLAPTEDGAACAQCAFFYDIRGCSQALSRTTDVFGGDCVTNDVIYLPSPSREKEEA